MSQKRYLAMAILCVESDTTKILEFDDIINSLADLKTKESRFFSNIYLQ